MIAGVTRQALFCCAVLASAGAHAASTGSFKAEYDGYSHGLVTLKMSASLTLTPTGYSGRLAFHTAGLVGFMVHVESDSQVAGHFDGERAVPESFSSTGVLHGTTRTVSMHWHDSNPVIDAIAPPPEPERTKVPPELQAHTIDALSAMAALVRQANDGSRCDGDVTVFDGRRLSHMAAHFVGHELPPPSAKSHYDAPALRCDFEGQEVAGFLKNESEADQRRTRHGSAWLAPLLPDAPMVPERIVFEHKVLGQVTLYLTSVTAGPVAGHGTN
jgi:Protein of unknown function (DUF3108)